MVADAVVAVVARLRLGHLQELAQRRLLEVLALAQHVLARLCLVLGALVHGPQRRARRRDHTVGGRRVGVRSPTEILVKVEAPVVLLVAPRARGVRVNRRDAVPVAVDFGDAVVVVARVVKWRVVVHAAAE